MLLVLCPNIFFYDANSFCYARYNTCFTLCLQINVLNCWTVISIRLLCIIHDHIATHIKCMTYRSTKFKQWCIETCTRFYDICGFMFRLNFLQSISQPVSFVQSTWLNLFKLVYNVSVYELIEVVGIRNYLFIIDCAIKSCSAKDIDCMSTIHLFLLMCYHHTVLRSTLSSQTVKKRWDKIVTVG